MSRRRRRRGFGALAAAGLLPLLGTSPILGEPTTEDVVRAYVEVWNSGELDRLDELLTEDFKRHGGFGAVDSRDALKRVIRNSRGFYRGLHIEVDDVVANPRKGAMRLRFTGRWGETRFVLDSVNFAMVHFRGGKIAEEWVLGNNMDLFRTFGYRLTPPQHEIVPPPIEEPPGPTLEQRMAPRAAELRTYAEETRREAPKSAGELEIATDVACRLFVDGRSIGGLGPGGSVSLALGRGEHFVRAASLGGSVFFEETVTVRRGASKAVTVAAPGRVVVQPRKLTTEDLSTGLMWQMTDGGKDATLAAAEAHCRDLTQGGHDDWRLPTIHELLTLHDPATAETKRYHSIDGVKLSDCCPWTSTTHGDFTWTYAFSMDMRYLQYEALGWHMRALCVRDAAGSGT